MGKRQSKHAKQQEKLDAWGEENLKRVDPGDPRVAYPLSLRYPANKVPLLPVWFCPAYESDRRAYLQACAPRGPLAALPAGCRLAIYEQLARKPLAPPDPVFGCDWRSADLQRHVIDTTLYTWLYRQAVVRGKLDLTEVEYDDEAEQKVLDVLMGSGAGRSYFSGGERDITMYRYESRAHLLAMVRALSYVIKTIRGS